MPAELPSGTVTLLFTDIEGSTRMLQELGREAYVRALTEHRRLLREAFTAQGGVEVEMQGDSFHFAFPFARDAVAAAVAGQRALGEHTWESQPIKVRIGLHTGEPMQADGLYAGLDVHHAARIMSAAHGGQILLSARTAELVTGELGDLQLRDLGEHRLKDLTAPQRLYQAGAGDFPPLKALTQTNLPLQPTPLVGRDRERAELEELLAREHVRLLTLIGPGGVGKTRLSLDVAAEAADRFADGVAWVSLATLAEPELVVPTVARALDVREAGEESIGVSLRSFLASRQMLLLLDNFEHVLDAGAAISELLAWSPNLRVLVTSRAPLELSGEHLYEVPPLQETDAIELFVERAAQVGRHVVPSQTVAAICGRLDWLPLAIELAAAHVRVLEPDALLERLDRRLPLLRGGARDLPARQQTLRATIEWSHDLLDDEERVLFRRLSVFSGSFTLEGAEAVAQGEIWTLESLVGKNLVRRWGSGRLGQLMTIREFAEEQLEVSGEGDATRARHASYYLALACEHEPHLVLGSRRAASVDVLGAEVDNVLAALSYLERSGREDELLRLATALWRFWMARGSLETAERWLQRGLRHSSSMPPALRARALEGLGGLNLLRGNVDEGEAHTGEALALFRKLNDGWGIAESLNNMGIAASIREDFQRAEELYREAADLARVAGELSVLAMSVANLAGVALEQGEHDRAIRFLDEAVSVYEQLGDAGGEAAAKLTLGQILVLQGRMEDAARSFADALALVDELPQREMIGFGLLSVAALVSETDTTLATHLTAAADALFDVMGVSRHLSPTDRAMREQVLGTASERLGDSAFEAAYRGGREMSFADAVASAVVVVTQRAGEAAAVRLD